MTELKHSFSANSIDTPDFEKLSARGEADGFSSFRR